MSSRLSPRICTWIRDALAFDLVLGLAGGFSPLNWLVPKTGFSRGPPHNKKGDSRSHPLLFPENYNLVVILRHNKILRNRMHKPAGILRRRHLTMQHLVKRNIRTILLACEIRVL